MYWNLRKDRKVERENCQNGCIILQQHAVNNFLIDLWVPWLLEYRPFLFHTKLILSDITSILYVHTGNLMWFDRLNFISVNMRLCERIKYRKNYLGMDYHWRFLKKWNYWLMRQPIVWNYPYDRQLIWNHSWWAVLMSQHAVWFRFQFQWKSMNILVDRAKNH